MLYSKIAWIVLLNLKFTEKIQQFKIANILQQYYNYDYSYLWKYIVEYNICHYGYKSVWLPYIYNENLYSIYLNKAIYNIYRIN